VASDFHDLLKAALVLTRDLKDRGVAFVDVHPETMTALARLRPPQRVSAPAVRMHGDERISAMAQIRERALVCQKCPHLVRSRTQVVFGVGNVAAELMFVGEAPGAEEDRQGEPFVGPAGQLLTRMIAAMGFSREDVYIANILKCRPDVTPGTSGNRPPKPDEMDTCKPYLLSQIDIIKPRVIVALGNIATQGLLGSAAPPAALRGTWQSLRGIPVMPTFHPSYLLRSVDGPDRGNSEKRKTW
jgi:DNA polymerase